MATPSPHDTAQDFYVIDEALYRLERPFYRACAGGAHFDITKQWEAERARLTTLWLQKCPWKGPETARTPEKPKLARLWFALRNLILKV